MAFISKEIPVWAIDWVNKIYTFANPISQLDDVWVDWAIYPNVTVTWTYTILLVDGPTLSILVDYYDTPATNPPTWKFLVSELRTLWERYQQNNDIWEVTDANFIDFANDLNLDYYDKYVEINPWDFTLSTTFTTTSSDYTNALPTDIQNIESVYTVDDNWLQQELLNSIHLTWRYWYYYENWNIVVRWFPNKTIEVRYFDEPITLSTTTEATLIDNKARNNPIVRNLISMLYQWWANNNSLEVRESQKYQQDLSKLVLKTSKDSTNPDLSYDIYS